ncbi:MAG TPA: flagellar motor protein MotB [Pirellulales bacterium]|nr:flagellar motor protein MotB [Pirellulales bacterium]
MTNAAQQVEEGLPEWIMSYADMITILMAFFVVMYSMAGAKDTVKEAAVLRSLRQNLGPFKDIFTSFQPAKSRFSEMGGGTRPSRPGEHGPLGHGPAGSGAAARNNVPRLTAGQPLARGGVIYFAQGAAGLSEENKTQLDLAVEELSGKPQRIEVRGHASRRPLAENSPYRDHWDLAYARCRETMDYLVAHGIAPERIRLGVASQTSSQAASRPLLLVSESWVEIYMLNEFRDRRETLEQEYEQEKAL